MEACATVSPRDRSHRSIFAHTIAYNNTSSTKDESAAEVCADMTRVPSDSIHQIHGHSGYSYSNLPSELILLIFKFLLTARDLRSAVLVCKLWCSCGMDLLWSKPSLPTLAAAEKMIHTLCLPSTIFPYADYIRRLNLAFLSSDVTDSMLECFASCSRLERLLLAGSVQISSDGLNKVLSRCSPVLFSLDLSEIPAVTDTLVESVAAGCPKLQTLYLGSCSAITDESIVKLAKKCPQLKRIKLSHCSQLTDRSIAALTQFCPQLTEMDVTNCNLVSSDAIQSVFGNLPQIRDINMTLLVNLTNAAFASIHPSTHRFEQLRVLNLTSCALITDDTLLRIIPATPRLRSLALTKCDKITDIGASVIKTLGKHLHYLHLGHCAKITDRLVATIAQHCTRIRYLDLACCSKLTDAAVFALAQLPKLRRIGLVKCSNITDHGIYAMLVSQILPQTLERVHLSYCVHLSESAVAALVSQCSKMTHLSLTGVPAFISPCYQQFCRAPPPEFTAHQREVFCVFSGKGVRELRNHMQENPPAIPSSTSMASIRASYRRISSSVASMIAGSDRSVSMAEEDGMSEELQEQTNEHEQESLLVQIGSGLLATSAGMIVLPGTAIAPALTNGQAPTFNQSHHGQQSTNDMMDVVMEVDYSLSTSLSLQGAVVTEASEVFLDNSSSAQQNTTGGQYPFRSNHQILSITPTSANAFPILQHPHHRHHDHLHDHLDRESVVLHRSSMEVDENHSRTSASIMVITARAPSPSILARSLNREGEGSGAGSASPVEEEEEGLDDEDEDF
ncbi:SCF ubiquitin ligase complex subunit [Lobosporangium transversale]|nr:SCF ubiquitin ligase complex subunit [Lobosporangium transversale]